MKLHIAVLPGDGIGPEVVEQALNVTKAVCEKFGHSLEYQTAPVGACAIEETGLPYPDSTHELCMRSDAVLFGAIGSPQYDNNPNATVRPEQGLLAMRKKLGLFANIRPITTFPGLIHKSPLRSDIIDGADFMCIRELTGGLYFGRPQGRSEDGNIAYDTCIYSRNIQLGLGRKTDFTIAILDDGLEQEVFASRILNIHVCGDVLCEVRVRSHIAGILFDREGEEVICPVTLSFFAENLCSVLGGKQNGNHLRINVRRENRRNADTNRGLQGGISSHCLNRCIVVDVDLAFCIGGIGHECFCFNAMHALLFC